MYSRLACFLSVNQWDQAFPYLPESLSPGGPSVLLFRSRPCPGGSHPQVRYLFEFSLMLPTQNDTQFVGTPACVRWSGESFETRNSPTVFFLRSPHFTESSSFPASPPGFAYNWSLITEVIIEVITEGFFVKTFSKHPSLCENWVAVFACSFLKISDFPVFLWKKWNMYAKNPRMFFFGIIKFWGRNGSHNKSCKPSYLSPYQIGRSGVGAANGGGGYYLYEPHSVFRPVPLIRLPNDYDV